MHCLPQMSGYIKYFENDGKIMPFKVKHDNVLEKYYQIWNKTNKMLNREFHSKPVYDEKYIKSKVKTFNGVVNTIFWNDKIPKENVHCTYIAVTSIGSLVKIDKKNYP